MVNRLVFSALWHDEGVNKGIDDIGDRLGRNADKQDQWRNRTKVAFAAGAAAVFAFGKSSVDAYVEAEASQAHLEDAFSRFPALADINIDSLRSYNSELAKKVKFDDDAIASGQAILAQFKLTGTQLKAATPLLVDYAAKTGQDVPGAAEKLGKAFMGNTKALKELGISYHSTGDQAKDTENIMGLLRAQVGGFAEKEGATAAGRAAILKNQFGEMQENIGSKLLPVLIKLGEIGMKALQWIDDHKEAAMVIGSLTAAMWLLNAALAANPFTIVAFAVVALVSAFVYLWTTSAGFRLFFINMWNDIKGTVNAVVLFVTTKWNDFIGFFSALPGRIAGIATNLWNSARDSILHFLFWAYDRWNDFVNFIRSIPNSIGAALGSLGGILGSVFKGALNIGIDAINWFIDRANSLIHGINWVTSKVGIPGIPDISRINRMHSGGIVPGPSGRESLAILEAGEEVIPANRAGRSGGATVHVHFHGPVGSRQELENWLVGAMDGLRRRGRLV